MQSFDELGLSKEILQAVEDLGFETPSDIQSESIPILLQNETDLIGLAQTGTGKTAAFGLPLLEKIDSKNKSTQALVLAPTRELCRQITEQLVFYSKYKKKIHILSVYGGAAIVPQIKALKRPQHIIVATPGRLIDLIKRRAVQLGQLEYLILDEADEMLNMGFKEEIDEILKFTPDAKRTWLFSATMPLEIKRIVDTYMTDPHEIKIHQEQKVNKNIRHLYAIIKRGKKTEALMRFLDLEPDVRAVVFCRTRMESKELADLLLKENYRADAIHGDLSQSQRDRVMRRFKENQLQILVATDVAARGIDVNDLSHVFHYTLSDQVENYTHRSGRTARAGKDGTSIAFVNKNDQNKIKQIRRALKIEIDQVNVPVSEDIVKTNIAKWREHILSSIPGGKIPKPLFDETREVFSDLNKDQLLAHLITAELDRMNIEKEQDVNDEFSKGGSSGRREKTKFGKGKSKFSRNKSKKRLSTSKGKPSSSTDKSRYRRKKKA